MLKIHNLSVRYDMQEERRALRGVSFSLREGERCALIGANGAGKSTLLLTLCGVLRPVSGEVLLDGLTLEAKNLCAIRRRLGMVFQNPDDQLFMPSLYEDVLFGLRNEGLSEDEAAKKAALVLQRLGIAHLTDRMSHKLSGGEKRLAALAGVLVMEPSVFIADEPSSFLDPRARRTLIGILDSLPQTMLIATHDLDMALDLCPRTILLKEGRIHADAPSGSILRDEALLYDCGLELPLSLSSQR